MSRKALEYCTQIFCVPWTSHLQKEYLNYLIILNSTYKDYITKENHLHPKTQTCSFRQFQTLLLWAEIKKVKRVKLLIQYY